MVYAIIGLIVNLITLLVSAFLYYEIVALLMYKNLTNKSVVMNFYTWAIYIQPFLFVDAKPPRKESKKGKLQPNTFYRCNWDHLAHLLLTWTPILLHRHILIFLQSPQLSHRHL